MRIWLICFAPFLLLTFCTSQNGPGEGCSRLPPIENGDIINMPLKQYASGATVEYRCQSLYVMKGSSVVNCNNGDWTEAPVCLEPCIITTEDMDRYNIQLKWIRNQKIYSASGDRTEFSCRSGYIPQPSSPPFRALCTEGKLEYPLCVINEEVFRRVSSTVVGLGGALEGIAWQDGGYDDPGELPASYIHGEVYL
ncbi:complement factor H-related protein 2-like [Lacerta agilis]|uniref:complement factor H-related protein 2-like n=1 Tax=Lacerta agilis TaxID=80427 RepID=UPI00141A1C9E|nr:complement factor H-related protein 2-like [Lacerta agilis]